MRKQKLAIYLQGILRQFDDKQLDKKIVEYTFSKDAKIVRPDDVEIIGHDNIFDDHRKSFSRFKTTHHLFTNFLIDIIGETLHWLKGSN